MLTQQVNSNGVSLGHQYQQSIRSAAGGGEATVGLSLQVQRGSDGGLQYDSASFPVLSGGGGNGGNNRFSGLPMPQQQQQNAREEDFTIQNEDFPALPGSHVDRNSQKHEINSMMGNMMVGGQIQVPQGPDRIRELSQENLQHHLLEQQQQQQQQQLQLQLQQQGNAQNQAQGSAVSRGSSSLPQQQANALSIVESSAQGGNNSLANGSFLGIGVGGAIQGHLSSNGLGSTVGGTGVGIGGVGGVAGVSQSKEGGYGLAGLLDVIRMTDKVGYSNSIFLMYTDVIASFFLRCLSLFPPSSPSTLLLLFHRPSLSFIIIVSLPCSCLNTYNH